MPRRDIGPRSKQFLLELKAYCQAQEGRAARLAEYLEIPPPRVYGWWAVDGDRFPTTEQLLGAQEWIEKQS
jgi:hypothetical protein